MKSENVKLVKEIIKILKSIDEKDLKNRKPLELKEIYKNIKK